MKRRKDPAGYPGDDRITQRYNEVKEMVRKEQGLSEQELERELREGYEEAARKFAPLRRAMGIRFRAIREERGLTRNQLADRSNVPAREIGRMERGVSDFSVGDMVRLCLALKYDFEKLLEDVGETLSS